MVDIDWLKFLFALGLGMAIVADIVYGRRYVALLPSRNPFLVGPLILAVTFTTESLLYTIEVWLTPAWLNSWIIYVIPGGVIAGVLAFVLISDFGFNGEPGRGRSPVD